LLKFLEVQKHDIITFSAFGELFMLCQLMEDGTAVGVHESGLETCAEEPNH
jgi:hypothetical protein